MRVHEYAKLVDIPAKKLLTLLESAGLEAKSHMSALSDKQVALLDKELQKSPQKKEVEKKEAPKKEQEPRSQLAASTKKTNSDAMQQQSIRRPKIKHMKKPEEPKTLVIQAMMVSELAKKIGIPANELILMLLRWGIVATLNHVLADDVVVRIADHYGIKTERPSIQNKDDITEIAIEGSDLKERLPVIVVLGHVDHGKTTLLDFIRKTRVASREKGGITQHLGVYEAGTDQGNLIFLDTPGHEAFSKIRMRGVKVADIAVLVVAADDGIMPQTIEAIKFAKSMNVPIIVAINKIDKATAAQIEIVKRQLSQHDLLPEEWGGDVICLPISAKEGTGVAELLDMLVLQSQMMELKADVSGPAKGYVLESKFEKGRGPVATVISRHGNVKVGDYFIAGKTTGKISSMVNSYGKRVDKAGPSIPVQVSGFEALPDAGNYFEVVSKDEYRKAKAAVSSRKSLATRTAFREDYINLLVKTDTNSSKEALLDSIAKLTKKLGKGFNILQATVGGVSEGDVTLAANTGSKIMTLHVKVEPNAALLARRQGVSIDSFTIIYKLLEHLEELIESTKEVVIERKKVGEAIVLKVFNIKGVGVIAGSRVADGSIKQNANVIVWRGKDKVGEGKIKSLQRDKKTVKEVHSGFECGFMVAGFNDFEVDDRVECFIDMPQK